MGICPRRTDRHAELRTEEPVREQDGEHNHNRSDEENIRRCIQPPDIPLGKERLLLEERQICLAHNAQIDGVKSDHGQNTRKECRNLELCAEKARDNARDASRRTGGKNCRERRITRYEQSSGNCCPQRKAALDCQIGNVQNAIRQIDTECIEPPENPLRRCRNDKIHNVTP